MLRSNRNFSRALGLSALLAVTASLAGCGGASSVSTPTGTLTDSTQTQSFGSGSAPITDGLFGQNMTEQYEPNQLIVKSKAGTANRMSSLFTMSGTSMIKSFTTDADGAVYRLINVPSEVSMDSAMQAYANAPDTDRFNGEPVVERNLLMQINAEPNDPMFKDQWSLPKVKAQGAWDVTGVGASNMIVAVVDTGVDYNHPDLAGSIIKGPNLTGTGDAKDPIDSFGHGTHVSGIIMAHQNNGIGTTGVAPGVKVMAVEVLGANGGGNLFTIANGIKYAVDNGAKIVNLSLGGPHVKDLVSTAIGYYATQKKGALLVAAAGNSSGPVGTPAMIRDYYMAVAASDENDAKAKFSNFGPELSIISPGTHILNTLPSYSAPINKPPYNYPMNYGSLNGTSMACPLTAGAAALVWSAHPSWTYVQVRKELERTADQIGNGDKNLYGNGRLNVARALGAIK